MKSKLRDVALEKVMENAKTLGEVIRRCKDKQSLQDSCEAAPEFWKSVISQFLRDTVVRQRRDLQTGPEWYNFAQMLATGVKYVYCLQHNVLTNETSETPKPFNSVVPRTDDDDVEFILFDIEGVLPEKGKVGYLVELGYDSEAEQFSRRELFLARDDGDIVSTLQEACDFLGGLYHQTIRNFMYQQGFPDGIISISDAGILPDLDAAEELDTFDYFAKRIFVKYVKEKLDGGYFNTVMQNFQGEEVDTESVWRIFPVRF